MYATAIIFWLTGLKRKRAQSSASEAVMSAPGTATLAQLSTDTSASVVTNPGPAAKRSRRTTLTQSKQKKSSDGAVPAAVLFADIRKKRDEPQTPKGKQTTIEAVKVPLNCEMLLLSLYLRPR